MGRAETTTEALQRMLREQEEAKARKANDVEINHPNNRGTIVGTVRGNLNINTEEH